MSSTRTTAALAALITANQIDAAIEAGLLTWHPAPSDEPAHAEQVLRARNQLEAAWAARDRYRARAVRLRRREVERQARRAPAPVSTDSPPPLPTSVADILARAKARAAQGGTK